jgi:hypothetical protein
MKASSASIHYNSSNLIYLLSQLVEDAVTLITSSKVEELEKESPIALRFQAQRKSMSNYRQFIEEEDQSMGYNFSYNFDSDYNSDNDLKVNPLVLEF